MGYKKICNPYNASTQVVFCYFSLDFNFFSPADFLRNFINPLNFEFSNCKSSNYLSLKSRTGPKILFESYKYLFELNGFYNGFYTCEYKGAFEPSCLFLCISSFVNFLWFFFPFFFFFEFSTILLWPRFEFLRLTMITMTTIMTTRPTNATEIPMMSMLRFSSF